MKRIQLDALNQAQGLIAKGRTTDTTRVANAVRAITNTARRKAALLEEAQQILSRDLATFENMPAADLARYGDEAVDNTKREWQLAISLIDQALLLVRDDR